MSNSDSTKLWFDNLRMIQARMREISHLTKNNLKLFSKQPLSDLLKNDLDKGNLSQFCQKAKIGMVPTATFSDMSKDFRWFLDEVGNGLIKRIMIVLWYIKAASYNNALLSQEPSDIAEMTFDEAFGTKALVSNPAKLDLHTTMQSQVPKEFYLESGSQLKDGTKKVSEIIDSILD